MSVMVEGDLPERTQRIISMMRRWENAGYNAEELELMGLSEKAQEEYLVRALRREGIIEGDAA